jgi:hypothetical protein
VVATVTVATCSGHSRNAQSNTSGDGDYLPEWGMAHGPIVLDPEWRKQRYKGTSNKGIPELHRAEILEGGLSSIWRYCYCPFSTPNEL